MFQKDLGSHVEDLVAVKANRGVAMTRLMKIENRFRLLKAQIEEALQKKLSPSLELFREYELVRNALSRIKSPSLALARLEDLEMHQLFCYICLKCGHIAKRLNDKPESTVRCPLCGHDVLYWNSLELEVEARR